MQRKHEGCSARCRTAASRRAGSGWRPAAQTFPGLRAEVRLLREVAGLSQPLASHPPSSSRHTDRLAHEMMSRWMAASSWSPLREGAGAQRRAVLLLPSVGQGVRTQYVVVLTHLSVRRCRQRRERAPADQHIAEPREELPRERLREDVTDVVFRADSARTDVSELHALLDPVVVRANALVPCGHHPLNRPARCLVVVAQDRRRVLNAVAETHLLEQISYMFEFLRSRG